MFITGYSGCKVESSDKKESKKKKKKKDECKVEHDILYYIDKDDPLGPTEPNYSDPMVGRWDAGIDKGSEDEEEKKD
jgi:hypothetical protein